VDFVAIHIYPVTDRTLTNAVQMGRITRAGKKLVIIDETWLHKILKPGRQKTVQPLLIEVFRRDTYAFWEPLDKKFIALILKLARAEHVSLSFFWSGSLFGYLDYAPELERLSYNELAQWHNRVVYQNLRNGVLSGTGQYYSDLIAKKWNRGNRFSCTDHHRC